MSNMLIRFHKPCVLALWLVVLLMLSSCQLLLTPITNKISDDLASAILNHDDVSLIEDGLPAYLIMLDALIVSNPKNTKLLFAAAELNSAYAMAFVSEPERKQLMTKKAWDLATQAACMRNKKLCGIDSMSFAEVASTVSELSLKDVPTIYGVMSTWASWLDAHQSDYGALAQLPSVHVLLDRLLELDENYYLGAPHLYKAVLDSIIPPLLGGDLERAREHFEKVIELSSGKNLYAKVLMAKQYARLAFDRTLHDKLLNEVISADPKVKGFTFQNVLAQKLATELLNSADEYF
ncbi:MAG: hypothetical protein F4039_09505 [Gammaproteobacteria bacterium]|nr:hypothetical protein [Gammaproteobacteria bacterium]MYF53022.1 hypothetical protein [Gammaproteobacteria bacterium]MYK44307.1 hypothetical protein [Gammaproteobacteria bacterium]